MASFYFRAAVSTNVATAGNWFSDRPCTSAAGGAPGGSDDAYFELPTEALTGTLPAVTNCYVNMPGYFNGVVLGAISGTLRFDVARDQLFSCSGTIAKVWVRESGFAVVHMTAGTATTIIVGSAGRFIYGAACGATTNTSSSGRLEMPISTNAGGTIRVHAGSGEVGRGTTAMNVNGASVMTIGNAAVHTLIRVGANAIVDVRSGGAITDYEIAATGKLTAENSPYFNISVGAGGASYEADGADAFLSGNANKSTNVIKEGA